MLNWLRKRQLRKLEDQRISLEYPGILGVKKVALLFTWEEIPEEFVRYLLDKLESRQWEVQVLAYFPAKAAQSPGHLTWENLAQNECNWLGKPKGSIVQSFCANHYDLLIDCAQGKPRQLDFLRAMLNSALVVDIKPEEPGPYCNLHLRSDPSEDREKILTTLFSILKIDQP